MKDIDRARKYLADNVKDNGESLSLDKTNNRNSEGTIIYKHKMSPFLKIAIIRNTERIVVKVQHFNDEMAAIDGVEARTNNRKSSAFDDDPDIGNDKGVSVNVDGFEAFKKLVDCYFKLK